MTLRHIFNDLQSLDSSRICCNEQAARAGYFHWILSQADVASAMAGGAFGHAVDATDPRQISKRPLISRG